MPDELVSLHLLQREHDEWIGRNFPGELEYQPLLGMVEEIGELSRAHLKGEQGIRRGVDQIQVQMDKVDAVGDIVVYLAGYCSANGINLAEAVTRTWNKVKQRDWVADPVAGGE
jgi:NTP pyrophosphatase (non-canonical NTP hydrolase)